MKKRGSTLYYYFNYSGSEICISTGIRIQEDHWDKKKRKIGQKIGQLYHDRLMKFELDLRKAVTLLETRNETVTVDTLREAMNHSITTRKTIVELYDEYRMVKSMTITSGTLRKITQLRAKLRRFEAYDCARLSPDTFDRSTFARFTQYLALHERINDNTIASHTRVLKCFLKHCRPDKNWGFIKFRELYLDVIYLNEEEIQTLKSANNLPGYMTKTRDIFLVAYYTGVRYSDLCKISEMNRKGDMLHVLQGKTRSMAYPPFVKGLSAILDKYGGACPIISNVKLNVYVKALFKFLELSRPITVTNRTKGNIERFVYPLHDVVTMHVARKTFIMTLLSKGVPINDVMYMSGHSDFNSMRPYITANFKRLSELSREISELDYI